MTVLSFLRHWFGCPWRCMKGARHPSNILFTIPGGKPCHKEFRRGLHPLHDRRRLPWDSHSVSVTASCNHAFCTQYHIQWEYEALFQDFRTSSEIGETQTELVLSCFHWHLFQSQCVILSWETFGKKKGIPKLKSLSCTPALTNTAFCQTDFTVWAWHLEYKSHRFQPFIMQE